ncbi:MAG: pentapeptide repeat-containing protein [Planctomycetes bacterium]|nr:pentapeptide repeat-containing protein [Planctomycetota bacterium]
MADKDAVLEKTSGFPEVETIDAIIAGLEALIVESDETPLSIEVTDTPRHATYRVLHANVNDRNPKAADAISLNAKQLILRCSKTEVVRQMPLEVTVQSEKSGRGETMAIIIGKVAGLKRISGGYAVSIEISEMRKTRVTPAQKLRECLEKSDIQAWNRWCQDIKDTIELIGVDLQGMDLSGADLCCADLTDADLTGTNLTGAILSGADLTHCKLDQAIASGTDFFRAKMVRSQARVLAQSGMPEKESVIFTE